MNFVSRERDPNLVKLQNSVLNQMQNIVNPQSTNNNNNQTSSLDNESINAQNAVKAALQELLNMIKQ